jgi:ankyrin repeat protein
VERRLANAAGKDGTTLLMRAAILDRLDLAERLIGLGANPNRLDVHGETALSLCAMGAAAPCRSCCCRSPTAGITPTRRRSATR